MLKKMTKRKRKTVIWTMRRKRRRTMRRTMRRVVSKQNFQVYTKIEHSCSVANPNRNPEESGHAGSGAQFF
jgi:hypothetical protein